MRFRRIEVNIQGRTPLLEEMPADWLTVERVGARVMFVDSRYSEETAEALFQRHFPDAVATSLPMTLREIFLTIFRSNRKTAKGITL
jgi:hypothetical protein